MKKLLRTKGEVFVFPDELLGKWNLEGTRLLHYSYTTKMKVLDKYFSYLHEADFQKWETKGTVCWYGSDLVADLRIIRRGFVDDGQIEGMAEALEGWRPSQ